MSLCVNLLDLFMCGWWKRIVFDLSAMILTLHFWVQFVIWLRWGWSVREQEAVVFCVVHVAVLSATSLVFVRGRSETGKSELNKV